MFNTNRNNTMFTIVPIMMVLMIIVGIGAITIQYSNNTTYESCTITDKDRVYNSETQSSDMRVYSSCGVFQIKDMSFNLEFDSSDLFGSIETGKTYNFDTTGKRIPFLSMFPIIRHAHEV